MKTHRISLRHEYLALVKSGAKTLEGRCNTLTFKAINQGDHILFFCIKSSVLCEVIGKRQYPSFDEMLEAEDVASLLPGETRNPLTVYLGIPGYRDKSKRYGVVVFQVNVIT